MWLTCSSDCVADASAICKVYVVFGAMVSKGKTMCHVVGW